MSAQWIAGVEAFRRVLAVEGTGQYATRAILSALRRGDFAAWADGALELDMQSVDKNAAVPLSFWCEPKGSALLNLAVRDGKVHAEWHASGDSEDQGAPPFAGAYDLKFFRAGFDKVWPDLALALRGLSGNWPSSSDTFDYVMGFELQGQIAARKIMEGLKTGAIVARAEAITLNGEDKRNCVLEPGLWNATPCGVWNFEAGSYDTRDVSIGVVHGITFERKRIEVIWPPTNTVNRDSLEEGPVATANLKGKAGRRATYNWEAILIEAAHIIHEEGVPAKQKELIDKIQLWHCAKEGHEVGETQIKNLVSKIYKRFRE